MTTNDELIEQFKKSCQEAFDEGFKLGLIQAFEAIEGSIMIFKKKIESTHFSSSKTEH